MFNFFSNVLVEPRPSKTPSRFAQRIKLWTIESGKVVPFTASGGGAVPADLLQRLTDLEAMVASFETPASESASFDTADAQGKLVVTRIFGACRIQFDVTFKRDGTGWVKLTNLPDGIVLHADYAVERVRMENGDVAHFQVRRDGEDLALYVLAPLQVWSTYQCVFPGYPVMV
jgi:hypothetical protein